MSPWRNGVFALGGDKESARKAGIPTRKLTVQLYMLSGLAAALVGVIQAIANSNARVAAEWRSRTVQDQSSESFWGQSSFQS